jgi:diacylglycerol kinase (CTP)
VQISSKDNIVKDKVVCDSAPALCSRTDIHLPRRIFHMLSGIILAGAGLWIETKTTFVLFLAFLTALSLFLEVLRLGSPGFNRLAHFLGKPLLRTGEEQQMTGATYYLIGCTIAALVFPRAISVLAILYLGLGDPVASLVGLKWGRQIFSRRWFVGPSPWAKKSLEGSFACFVICCLVTFGATFLLGKTESLVLSDRILFSILGGGAAMFGEFLPLRTDDNLSLPLISGAALWLAATVFNLIPGLYF